VTDLISREERVGRNARPAHQLTATKRVLKSGVVDIHKEEYETHEPPQKKKKPNFFWAGVEKLSKPNSLFTNWGDKPDTVFVGDLNNVLHVYQSL
jgi:hypothetical protein